MTRGRRGWEKPPSFLPAMPHFSDRCELQIWRGQSLGNVSHFLAKIILFIFQHDSLPLKARMCITHKVINSLTALFFFFQTFKLMTLAWQSVFLERDKVKYLIKVVVNETLECQLTWFPLGQFLLLFFLPRREKVIYLVIKFSFLA